MASLWGYVAIFILMVIALLFIFWYLTLAGLILWACLALARRRRVRLEPPIPGPVYQRRWTTMRRWEAQQELAQWQTLFDTHLV